MMIVDGSQVSIQQLHFHEQPSKKKKEQNPSV